MDESSRQTLLRTACEIIASNKNNSITELKFRSNDGNADESLMILQSMANSILTNVSKLNLYYREACFTNDDNVLLLCDFILK